MKKERRRIYLIHPRLQSKLTGAFVGLATLALLLQFLFLGMRLIPLVTDMPGGGELAAAMPSVILQVMLFSFLILMPVVFLLGIRMTNRIAGPVYRMETFLRSVAAGKETNPCKLRNGDELFELCDLINEATAARRAQNAQPEERAAA